MISERFDLALLNKEVKNGGLFFGTKSLIKEIKKDNVSKIYISNDILEILLKDIEKEAKSKEIVIIKTDFDKEHLKEICKKPFNISVFGIKKGSEEVHDVSEEKEETRKEIRAKKDRLKKEKQDKEEHEEKIEAKRKDIEKDKEEKAEKEEKKKIKKEKKT